MGRDLKTKGDHFRRTNLIVLGNINSSRTVALLYGNRYCFVDGNYPGGDGFVVRTIHDPFGHGKNVVLLGGSSTRGIERAVEWLLPRLKGRDISLGRIVHVDGGVGRSSWEGMSAEEFEGRLARRNIRYTITAGLDCYTTNAGDLLIERFKRLFRACTEPCLKKPHDYHVTWRTGALVPVWDVIEEDPRFDDVFRLEVTNFLLEMCRGCFELKPRRLEDLVRDGMAESIHAQNHMTVSARALFLGGRYFKKYHNLEEADFWLKLARVFFKGMSTTHQIAENACSYGWINPEVAFQHALMEPDTTYMDRGILRVHADVAVAATNNLGLSAGYGDCPNYWYDPGAYKMLTRAAWWYRDAGYQWLVGNLFPARGLGVLGIGAPAGPHWTPLHGFAVCYSDVKPEKPDRFLGIHVTRLYPAPPDWYQGGYDAKDMSREPLPRVFDKITFRSDFDPASQYLMLAGRRGGGHLHSDMNSIVSLTDNGRLWVVDSSYSLRAPENHSGVVLMRNGQKLRSKRSAELDAMADLPTVGFTRTIHPGLGGIADWRRHVVWSRERFFLVVDELRAQEEGDYLARCYFRCLGEPSLTGARFTVTQQGEAFHICSDDATAMRVRAIDLVETPSSARRYRFATPRRRVLVETKSTQAIASPIVFMNLLSAEREGSDPPTLTSVSPTAARLDLGGEVAYAGIEGPDSDGLRAAAEAFVVWPDRCALLRATEFRLGDRAIVRLTEPASVELNLGTGRGAVQADRDVTLSVYAPGATTVTLDGEPVQVARRDDLATFDVSAGTHTFAVPALKPTDVLLSALREHFDKPQGASRRRAPSRRTTRVCEGLTVAWETPLGGSVSAAIPGQEGSVVVALTTQKIICLNAKGEIATRIDAPAKPLTLAVGQLDGRGHQEIVAGLDDRTVRAFDAQGRPIWSFGPMPEAEGRNRYGRSIPNVMRALSVTDINADGQSEVVVGAGHIVVLDAAGKQRWAAGGLDSTDGLRAMCVADLDGDGKSEILGADTWTYPFWYSFACDGQPFWRSAEGDSKRLYLGAAPAAVCAADHGIACADVSGVVHIADEAGRESAKFNAGDAATAMVATDFHGDVGLLVGTESHYVFALAGRGKARWQVNVGGPVVGLAATSAWIAAAVEGGKLCVLDKGGRVVARYSDPDVRPASVLAVDGRVVLTSQGGTVMAFDLAQ